MTDRRIMKDRIMKNRIMSDRIMIDKKTGQRRQRMMYKATNLMQKEDTDTEEVKLTEELQEISPETQEISLEILQEKGTDTEDSQIEVAAQKIEEDTMRMKETGRPAMERADIERVARSP